MSDIFLPILNTSASTIAPNILVMGDPNRAASAANLLENPAEVGNYREYRTFTGTYKNIPVTISSHGVGASGAVICFQELIKAGAQSIIRTGTCGGMQTKVKDGEMVIGTGAVRDDGTTPFLIPLGYPAISDGAVVEALKTCAAVHQVTTHTGFIYTIANLYPELLPESYDLYAKAGVMAVEMELAALLVVASLHGVKAGGAFISDGQPAEMAEYNPHREIVTQGVQKMLLVALDALVTLAD
jgi:uridine phosphorylase